jgi:hypothetical protein
MFSVLDGRGYGTTQSVRLDYTAIETSHSLNSTQFYGGIDGSTSSSIGALGFAPATPAAESAASTTTAIAVRRTPRWVTVVPRNRLSSPRQRDDRSGNPPR